MKPVGRQQLGLAVCALAACACETELDLTSNVTLVPGPRFQMDFDRKRSLWDAPVPAAGLATAKAYGRGSMAGPPPNVFGTALVEAAAALLPPDGDYGSQMSAIYLRPGAPILPKSLPAAGAAPSWDDSVVLFADVPTGPVLVPIDVELQANPVTGEPLLALRPRAAYPLQPKTRYISAATGRLRHLDHTRPTPALQVQSTFSGLWPFFAGIWEFKEATLTARQVLSGTEVVAVTTFMTDDVAKTYQKQAPTHGQTKITLAADPNAAEAVTGAGFCGQPLTVLVPDTNPVFSGGDAVGPGSLARLCLTIPTGPMPKDGWPLAVWVGAGFTEPFPLLFGDGAKPQVALAPAAHLAAIGIASVMLDGPFQGLRAQGGTAKADLYLPEDPKRWRAILRQLAWETVAVVSFVDQLPIKVCGGVGEFLNIDAKRLALVAHGHGTRVVPVLLSGYHPFTAAVSSAGGGGWDPESLEPALRKNLASRLGWPAAEHYRDRRLDPHFNLLDWAMQAADPLAYAHRARGPQNSDVHHLAIQGVVSTQTPAVAANAYHAALGLSPALPVLDAADPEIADGHVPSAGVLLPQLGFAATQLPASANQTARKGVPARTAVLVQLLAPPGVDGHRVLFASEQAWRVVRCFLQSWRDGKPTVGNPGACQD